MIRQGATSFWEEWQVTGTFREGRWVPRPRSHCHAWSAASTAWLSRYVLGVCVTSIQDRTVVIAPQPGGLQRASGTVPTRFGLVEVTWEIVEDRLQVDARVPEGARAELVAPAPFQDRFDGTVH